MSQKEALAIWDKFGPVGTLKNGSPTPYLFSIDPTTGGGSAMSGQLPPFLDTIDPAVKGALFRDEP